MSVAKPQIHAPSSTSWHSAKARMPLSACIHAACDHVCFLLCLLGDRAIHTHTSRLDEDSNTLSVVSQDSHDDKTWRTVQETSIAGATIFLGLTLALFVASAFFLGGIIKFLSEILGLGSHLAAVGFTSDLEIKATSKHTLDFLRPRRSIRLGTATISDRLYTSKYIFGPSELPPQPTCFVALVSRKQDNQFSRPYRNFGLVSEILDARTLLVASAMETRPPPPPGWPFKKQPLLSPFILPCVRRFSLLYQPPSSSPQDMFSLGLGLVRADIDMLACTMPVLSDDAAGGELAAVSRRLTDGTALSGAAWEEERRRKKHERQREGRVRVKEERR